MIVDFWAEWCGPCRAVSPILEQIAEERADELRVVKVNIDEEPELQQRYGILSIPTILLFKGGEPAGSRDRRAAEADARAVARPRRSLGAGLPQSALLAIFEEGVERRMVAEERLDGVEALRNPGVDPVVAQVVFDRVCPVVHVRPFIGRRARGLYRPFGLSSLAVRLVLAGRDEGDAGEGADDARACWPREIRSPRTTRARSTVTTG